jgi:N-hydroxyarylamine O-acetyltransferase
VISRACPVAERYLARIGHPGSIDRPDLATLRQLQIEHLVAVPFENLDVFHRRGVSTDVERSLDVVVDRRRGGWCFTLNGAFGWLLAEVGYDVRYVSCRVHDDGWGPELDHCALVVTVDGKEWFVDVGFGDAPWQPLSLEPGDERRVMRSAEGWVIGELGPDGSCKPRLAVDPTQRDLGEFDDRSRVLQTEPGLEWTAKPFATRAVDDTGSRITLRSSVLRVRQGMGPFVETPVEPADWATTLRRHFGIDDRRGQATSSSTGVTTPTQNGPNSA